MTNFADFGLSPVLMTSLAQMNYSVPTPIQSQAIPLALAGNDIMGTAQTGTGKTAAFAIPLVEKLLTNDQGSALVLTPTRELGKQIMDIMHQLLGPKSPIKTAFIIGGEPMAKQYSQLRARPRLIVGTPGRINDHLERGSLKLKDAHFLVLDETDRMLDMGFAVQLERIFKYMPAERQTLMFSATLPKNILKLSENYLKNPQRVAVGETNVVAKNIKQEVIRIEQNEKYDELLTQLEQREGSVIIFVKTKFGADRMAKNLRRDGHTSEALHGDLRQAKRDKVMQDFRKMNFRVLIATDIAARGLDVPHIEHVINYDLPQVAEDFIHRMGRTARAGAEGSAVSFVSGQDNRKWRAIELLLNPKAANDSSERSSRQGARRPRQGGKPAGRSGGRFEGRGEGRSAGRFEGRQENRYEGRREGRYEGRSENRYETRGEGRYENRGGDRFEGRFEGRGEGRPSGGRGGYAKPARPRGEYNREENFSREERRPSHKPTGNADRAYVKPRGRSFDDSFEKPQRKEGGKPFGKSQAKPQGKSQGKPFGKSANKAGGKPFGKPQGKPQGGKKGFQGGRDRAA
ncbi:MAG: DEAD/DEAH box helicase [Micavibrio sp.]